MLKGAIDNLHPDKVGGWMFSPQCTLRGYTVLAFVDNQCVGSGRIELFRQDLADAGLGDGYLGFDFPISLSKASELGRVVVRLDTSDAFIMAPNSRIISSSRASSFGGTHHTPESIEWMRTRGWLSAIDFTFMKSIQQLGAFEYSLVRPRSQPNADQGLVEAGPIATELLRTTALTMANISRLSLDTSDRDNMLTYVLNALTLPLPVVALHAEWSDTIAIIEGSHNDDTASQALDGAISYPIGPDRLLFLNLLCSFRISKSTPGKSLTMYVAQGS